MHLHAHKPCSAHELCTSAELCDWSAGAFGVTTMLGVSLQARRHTTQVMLGLSLVLRARWDTILASTASNTPPVRSTGKILVCKILAKEPFNRYIDQRILALRTCMVQRQKSYAIIVMRTCQISKNKPLT